MHTDPTSLFLHTHTHHPIYADEPNQTLNRSLPPLEYELLRRDDGKCLVRFRASSLQYVGKANTNRRPSSNLLMIQRLGDILCHDQTLAAAMLLPQQSLVALLDSTPHHRPALPSSHLALITDPTSILFVMDDPGSVVSHQPHATAFLKAFLERTLSLPSHHTTTYDPPISLVAWKIDTPPRILTYTGTSTPSQHHIAQPHTLTPKAMLNERSKRPTPARIHLLTQPQQQPGDIVRASLASYPIIPFKETLAKKGKVTAHTLEEAIASFIDPPPSSNHTTTQLHQPSPQWTQSYMDCR